MKYNELSEEAREVLLTMVDHCINQGHCMGMDEGINPQTDKPYKFREELESFTRGN